MQWLGVGVGARVRGLGAGIGARVRVLGAHVVCVGAGGCTGIICEFVSVLASDA